MDTDGVKKSKKDGTQPTVVLVKKTSKLSLNHHQPSKPVPTDTVKETSSETTQTTSTSSRNHSMDRKQPPVVSEKTQRLNMVKPIQDPSKNPAVFRTYQYHCQLCNNFLKDTRSITDHIQSEGHVERLEDRLSNVVTDYLPSATDDQLSAMTRLVEKLYQTHSAHTNYQDGIREGVAFDLDKLLKPVIQDAYVELFGSSLMQCALKSSDINLNINIENTEISNKDVPALFMDILKLMKSSAMKVQFSAVMEDFYSHLKIPRIIFTHTPSKLRCTLRIGSFSPVQTSSLIGLYNRMDPRVSKLCVAMKYWAKVLRIDASIDGHYPSVVVIVMVIHYLQQTTPPVLPVLHEEVKCDSTTEGESDTEHETMEGNGGCGLEEAELEPEYSQLESAAKNWQSSNSQSLGELLLGLVRYYAVDFDHLKFAVSIRHFEPVVRSTREGWGSHKLAVEDPFLTKNNISKAAGSDKVYEYFIKCLKVTYLHLLQVNTRLRKLIKGITTGTIEELPEVDATEWEQDCDKDEMEDTKPDVTISDDKEGKPGSRNVTAEILNEMRSSEEWEEKQRVIGRKAARTRRFRAQILKALKEIELGVEERGDYSLSERDFKSLLKNYPVACISCRRARHTVKDCPDEVIPRQNNLTIPPVDCLMSLDRLLNEYMAGVMLRPEEEHQRDEIRSRILQDIHSLYPKASLELFGSSANLFGHRNSDLDLCLIMNENYECDKTEIIEQIAKLFRKNSFYRGVSWIRSARVPIIKLSIEKWNMECDISMENRLALQNTRMLAAYALVDRRVRVLGYALKMFAKACDMCDASTGSISSYAYILMLIHFLQQYRLLPVLQQLPPMYSHQMPSGPVIEDWNCYFFDQIQDLYKVWKPPPREYENMVCADLWLRFLFYYLHDFDWKYHVVTIKQLRPLDKFTKGWTAKPIAIEDPFNLDHNLGQAVTPRMRFYILKRFNKAYQYHSKPTTWKHINNVMDPNILCGEYRPPKFIICDNCNRRGHKAVDCKKENVLGNETNQERQPLVPSGHKSHGNDSKSHKGRSDSKGDAKAKSKSKGNEDKVGYEAVDKGERKSRPDIKAESKLKDMNHQETMHVNDDTLLPSESQHTATASEKSSVAVKTRSQMRDELMEETGSSYSELKRIHSRLKGITRSGKGTSADKRRMHACGDLLKKLQKKKDEGVSSHEDQTATVTTGGSKGSPVIDKPNRQQTGSVSTGQQTGGVSFGQQTRGVSTGQQTEGVSVGKQTGGVSTRQQTGGVSTGLHIGGVSTGHVSIGHQAAVGVSSTSTTVVSPSLPQFHSQQPHSNPSIPYSSFILGHVPQRPPVYTPTQQPLPSPPTQPHPLFPPPTQPHPLPSQSHPLPAQPRPLIPQPIPFPISQSSGVAGGSMPIHQSNTGQHPLPFQPPLPVQSSMRGPLPRYPPGPAPSSSLYHGPRSGHPN